MLRGFTQNPPPLVKCAQDAAQVSGIQFKFFAQFRSCGLLAVGEFVEHADFTQGQRTVEQPFLQNTDLPRVEAIEAPDSLNALTEFIGTGRAACHEISVGRMIDFVNHIVAIYKNRARLEQNKNARHQPGVSNSIDRQIIRCAYPVPSESSLSAHSRRSALSLGLPRTPTAWGCRALRSASAWPYCGLHPSCRPLSCLDIPWPVHPRWVRLRGRGRTKSPKSPPAPAGRLSARPGQNSHQSLPQSHCPPFFLQLRRSPEAVQIGESGV